MVGIQHNKFLAIAFTKYWDKFLASEFELSSQSFSFTGRKRRTRQEMLWLITTRL